jgi:hypothetical protein
MGAVAAAGATGPVAPTELAAGTSIDIHGGSFARSTLTTTPPPTLAQLRAAGVMDYVMAVDGANQQVGEGGVRVTLQAGAGTEVNVHADAAGGASQLIWMQNLAVASNVTAASLPDGRSTLIAAANASGAGSDAEVGVASFSHHIASNTGTLQAANDILASADSGGRATAHFGDISVSANGDDAYAYANFIRATAATGGQAHVIVDGDVSFASSARSAHSYVLIDANGGSGSAADVNIHGNVNLNSVGTERALARAIVDSEGGGAVHIDGDLSLSASAPGSAIFSQVMALDQSSIHIGGIDLTVSGASSSAWLDLFSDHAGGVTVGHIDVNVVDASSNATVNVQHANNDPVTQVVGSGFQAHPESAFDLSVGTANLNGAGNVSMFLNSQTFGTVNQAATLDEVDFHFQLAEQNYAGVGSAPTTTINGFSGLHDMVIYNGVAADATNFADARSHATLADLNAAINLQLDGIHDYVFAVYTGSGDISGDGVSDAGSGVLAWDGDGNGVTSVLMLPGVTSMTPADLA